MLTQYPHILVIEHPTTQPEIVDGEWVFGDVQPIELECRAEPNSKGGLIPSASGTMVDYSFSIYLPLMDIDIPYGCKCTLTRGKVEFESSIKFHMNYQLHSEIKI